MTYQGIDVTTNQNINRLRAGAGNADANVAAAVTVSNTNGNKCCVPLEFELLNSRAPFYQSAVGDRLEYELLQLSDCNNCQHFNLCYWRH